MIQKSFIVQSSVGIFGLTFLNEAKLHRASLGIVTTHFFYKQPHFPVEPRVAIGRAQNEAESCYEVANVFRRL